MKRLVFLGMMVALLICISVPVIEAAGYWRPDGNVEFCNSQMPPRASGGIPAGPLHNGSVKGNYSGYTYQETRDWGVVSRWNTPVHEYVQWAAGFSGFPNQIAAGELVPIKASLTIYANTYRGTSSNEYSIESQVFHTRKGCSNFPFGPDSNGTLFAYPFLIAREGKKSESAVNQHVRMPDNSQGNVVNLVWRMGWGISDGGPKDTDWVVVLQRYKWVEGVQVNWQGDWQTAWGPIRMTQSGNRVTGVYEHRNGRIDAQVVGNKIIGHWYQDNGSGQLEFEMSNNGAVFYGKWKYSNQNDWGEWNGKRL